MRRTGQSFKETLNGAIRKALARNEGTQEEAKVVPLFHHPFPPEISDASMNLSQRSRIESVVALGWLEEG